MAFDRRKPYNDLPPLPPRADIETKAVLRKAISAGRALAELKGLGETIPNQAILVNSLVLQEARASSEIENILTSEDALYRALTAQGGQVDPATKEVIRYREALWMGHRALKAQPVLSTELSIMLVQTIKDDRTAIRRPPQRVVIANRATEEVIYTPPEGESVIRDKLANLQRFAHATDSIDPLIKLPVIHYQFEAIHPFTDGNGRTGRILNILYLVQCGLLELPVLYLSKFILAHKSDYYWLLRGVTEKEEWEPWILYMLQAVEETAAFTRIRILAIRDLIDGTIERAKRDLPRRVYSKELIELLFQQPYTKVKFLVDAGIAQRKTAAEYLRELERVGILKSERRGREVLYLNLGLFDLLSQ